MELEQKIDLLEVGSKTEDLAQRLRSLYQMYNCESELPEHSDLVTKLTKAKPDHLDKYQEFLDSKSAYQISYQEALQEVQQRGRWNYKEVLDTWKFGLGALSTSPITLALTPVWATVGLPLGVIVETLDSFKPNHSRAKRWQEVHNEAAREEFEQYFKAVVSYDLEFDFDTGWIG
ncbi:MAG TPA: hypothetical protein VJB13_01445 [Candidatus Nanoarchaeia archaeon]|nr:hypothetical protein [Candidatus Nanoarchaeia archaeon]